MSVCHSRMMDLVFTLNWIGFLINKLSLGICQSISIGQFVQNINKLGLFPIGFDIKCQYFHMYDCLDMIIYFLLFFLVAGFFLFAPSFSCCALIVCLKWKLHAHLNDGWIFWVEAMKLKCQLHCNEDEKKGDISQKMVHYTLEQTASHLSCKYKTFSHIIFLVLWQYLRMWCNEHVCLVAPQPYVFGGCVSKSNWRESWCNFYVFI